MILRILQWLGLHGEGHAPVEVSETVVGVAFFETKFTDTGGSCTHAVVFLTDDNGHRWAQTKTEYDGQARRHGGVTQAVVRWEALGVLPQHVERPSPSGRVLSLVEGGAA